MKQNIIVIEKNESVRYLLSTVLQNRYRVSAFPDCYQAFGDLMSKEVDLVILSVNGRDQQGIDFLEHIQTSRLHFNLPVIIISNEDMAGLKGLHSSYNFHAGGFFAKPFDPMHLVKKVEDLLTPAERVFEPVSDYRIESTRPLKVRLTS